jgi:GNAT superfamily N-acetyltransferase
MTLDVTTTYLEMRSKSEFRPKNTTQAITTQRVSIPIPELNRFFYIHVGHNHYWYDRLNWSHAQWKQWVDRPEQQTWIIYVQDTPAGYFELEKAKATVNIVFFGLLPQFIGQGLGAGALSLAIDKAWEFEAERVTLNTCTLDHPHALVNYQARGFKIYDQKTESRTLPESKPEVWSLK